MTFVACLHYSSVFKRLVIYPRRYWWLPTHRVAILFRVIALRALYLNHLQGSSWWPNPALVLYYQLGIFETSTGDWSLTLSLTLPIEESRSLWLIILFNMKLYSQAVWFWPKSCVKYKSCLDPEMLGTLSKSLSLGACTFFARCIPPSFHATG